MFEENKKTAMKETTVINIMDSQLRKGQILVTNLNVPVLGDKE